MKSFPRRTAHWAVEPAARLAAARFSRLIANRALALSVLLAILPAVGCRPAGTPDYQVNGTVTWQGKPVDKGDIILVARDKQSRAAATKIVNGKFTLRIAAGQKRVEIYASRDSNRIDPAMQAAVPESYIPPEFNVQSTLEAEIQPRDDNELVFDLKPQRR